MAWANGHSEWLLAPLFGVPIIKNEIRRPAGKSYIPMEMTGVGVLHTTEGQTVASAFAALSARYSAPHFIVGENKIIACRPLGVQGAALVDPGNRRAFVQIEMVGFTGGMPDLKVEDQARASWLPVESTLCPLAALMAHLAMLGLIPLKRGYPWPDDCSDMKGQVWATQNNSRRRSGAYNRNDGWFSHLEVPANSHYDCGAMRFAEVVAAAQKLLPAP
jgi:hypothetical protein